MVSVAKPPKLLSIATTAISCTICVGEAIDCSVAASVVSEVVRQQIEAREAAAAAAADAPPMSSVQIAQHQATIAALLKVGRNIPLPSYRE